VLDAALARPPSSRASSSCIDRPGGQRIALEVGRDGGEDSGSAGSKPYLEVAWLWYQRGGRV